MAEQDYTATRLSLEQALAALDRVRLMAGRTNLAPATPPEVVGAQIDDLGLMVAEVADHLDDARAYAAQAARRTLRLCS